MSEWVVSREACRSSVVSDEFVMSCLDMSQRECKCTVDAGKECQDERKQETKRRYDDLLEFIDSLSSLLVFRMPRERRPLRGLKRKCPFFAADHRIADPKHHLVARVRDVCWF